MWSPDGTHIAYSHFDFGPRPGTGSGSVDLWLMNRDGTSQHELVGPCSCFAAKWSHDSSFILYGLADENDVGVAIDRVDADGTGNRTLIGTDGGASTSFAVGLAPGSLGLSTDDGTIFFAHTHTGGPCCDAHVYSASAVDGSGLMQLTHEHGYALDLVSGSTGAAAESLGTPPPTPGLVLGPQKVSNVKLAGGDLLEVGFDLSVKGTKAPTTVTVSGVSATFDVTCTKTQKPGMIVVPIPDTTSTLPAKSAAWYPSGDAGDDATYQGQVTVPDTLCGPGGSINLRLGGTFAASVTSPDHGKSGIPVKVRWHYRAGSSGGKWSKAASIVPS